jgi:non-ribosomal peptide synthetase component E (peptide arylation enzyme)
LSRFTKFGGERTPLDHMQEKLYELARVTELIFRVAAVADETKGERLVVLHKMPPEPLPELLKLLQQSGLPNLWIPKPSQFFQAEQLPLVGPMKIDLRKLREMAIEISIPACAELKAAA